jgi:outer membrane protein OmpA-like peptidoglycan-associated protein
MEDRMLLIAWFLNIAVAQDAVKLEVIHTVHTGRKPALIVRPQLDASSLDIQFSCSGVQVTHTGPATGGAEIRMDIAVPVGTHQCSGSLDAMFTDGTQGRMPLSFQVHVQRKMNLVVSSDDLDLDNHNVRVHIDQPISKLDVDIYGETGQRLAAASRPGTNTTPVEIEWAAHTGTVVRLAVTATAPSGVSTTLNLFPWNYKVPHLDVVFPSGSATIPATEQHKLQDTMEKIQGVLQRLSVENIGFEIPMSLYVAGYTDTVGNRVANQQLSEKRARSMGQWFRQQGFTKPIYFQGFGENGLAVGTPDETDQPANRRALYIVAAESPKKSAALPAEHWKALN